MITATILLYCSSALGALLHSMVHERVEQREMREEESIYLSVDMDPVGGLTIIITLLEPTT